ncbi:MAG: hypothetical protein JWN48_5163 [Myxococcaceae bacterium]|nr:hypothetical protein [Myxococcaceae bacterium]
MRGFSTCIHESERRENLMKIRSREGAFHAAQRHEGRATASYLDFVDGLCERLSVTREHAAQIAASVLCVLEQRITREEGVQLEAQLPTKLQDLMFHCTMHVSERPSDIDRSRFIAMVAEDLSVPAGEAERYVRCVLSALTSHVSAGELEQVLLQLPPDLRSLWT